MLCTSLFESQYISWKKLVSSQKDWIKRDGAQPITIILTPKFC